MEIKIEDLEKEGYHLQDVLSHDELVPFVRKIFRYPNIVTRTYSWLNIALLLGLIGLMVYEWMDGRSLGAVIGQLGWGMLLLMLIIPVHEGLHGLAYRCLGATDIHYTANFKKFYFTAQAHHFIVQEQGFYLLAFTPFVLINLLALLAMIILPTHYLLMLSAFLFMHTTACGGDFALASYFYTQKNSGLLTFDDVPNKITYFYSLEKKEDELSQ